MINPEKEDRQHRYFKGVWICAALWTHPKLSWTEKCLVAEVDSLTSEARPCYASNEFLAGKMQISPVRIKAIFQKLYSVGVIRHLGFHRTFVERVVAPKYSSNPQTSQRWIKREAKPRGIENDTPRGIENNTPRGIENDTQRVLD